MKKIPYETDQNNPEVKAYVEAVKKGSSTPTPQQEKTFTEKATETARDFSDKAHGVKELPQRESDYRELRTKIGEILVKNNLRTDQVAISELAKVVVTELALQRREYENALNEAIELLEEQMDDEPCSYDHHGYCQTHWGGTDEDPTFCGMKKSKKVIQKCKALLQKGVK